ATVQAAFAEIYADASLAIEPSPLVLELVNWFMGPRVRALSKTLFGDAEGSHATPSEVSLTWHAYPSAERRIALEPEIAPTGPIRDAGHYRATFPDGRIGSNPGLASIEHGKRLYEAGLEDAMDRWRALVDG
ncbi:MAG: creatininase family protein, partial [Pseudomonadota bacterium]